MPRAGYWADQSLKAPSQNYRVRFLVIHYTSGDRADAFDALLGPHVSSHYLVMAAPREKDRLPVVYQLVDERRRAWHAGESIWRDRSNLNDSSIGIEIVNYGPVQTPDGVAWAPYTEAQIEAVIALTQDLVARYDIRPKNVVGHSDIALGRKIDPGPRFPWKRLAEAGVGAWPEAEGVAYYRRRFRNAMPDMRAIQAALAEYGYALPITGEFDERTRTAITAFQMHFRPSRYNGYPDADTLARLWALNDAY